MSVTTRRRFLHDTSQACLGAAAFAASAPYLARADDAPGRSITLGGIGAGGRGGFLISTAARQKGVHIGALCDVNRRRLSQLAQQIKDIQGEVPKLFEDFRELLDEKSVDAVIVATPHHWHVPIAIRALEAGKHVYLEKPASHVLREGRLLMDAAQRSSRIVQHGTQMRSSEVTARAGEVLASGLLGEIKMAKAWGVEPRQHPGAKPDAAPPDGLDWDFWLGPAPGRPFNPLRLTNWNNYRDYGNGEIGGDGIHDIDMARWGLGVKTHPNRITAHGSRIHVTGESDFPDNMIVTFRYGDDKVLVYENRNFAPYKMHGWDNGNVFYGTDDYMIFSRRGYFQVYLGEKEEKGPGFRGNAGNEEHMQNFIAAIRGEAEPNTDPKVAHLSCGLVHLGEIAYRTEQVLEFDPMAEKFSGNDEANALLTKRYRKPWDI